MKQLSLLEINGAKADEDAMKGIENRLRTVNYVRILNSEGQFEGDDVLAVGVLYSDSKGSVEGLYIFTDGKRAEIYSPKGNYRVRDVEELLTALRPAK